MSLEVILRKALCIEEADESAMPLIDAGRTVTYPADHLIFRQGDDGRDGLYIILSGTVRVFQTAPDGSETFLNTLEAGDSFGGVALFDGGRRTASVMTTAPCELLQLTRSAFEDCLAGLGTGLAMRVLESLSRQLRQSSERELQQKLQDHMLRSEMEMERHRALTSLVAGLAHEINTPLGIATTALSVIASRLPSLAGGSDAEAAEDVRESVDLALRNLRRADDLVTRFKKVSAGQVSDVLEEMDFIEAVADAVELFRPAARRARLEVKVEDDLPPEARRWRGYRGCLAQVILNGLTNVERYAYPPGAGGKVVVRASLADADRFAVEVRDFGRGLPTEDADRAFDPFFTTGRAKGGTGLGLAIVRSIVSGPLQGEASLQSRPGEGACLRAVFPRVIEPRAGESTGQSS